MTTKSPRSEHLREKTTDIKGLSRFEDRSTSFYNRLIRKNNPLAVSTTSFKTPVDIVESILIYTLKSMFFKCVTGF